jgi:predicted amidohydrolase
MRALLAQLTPAPGDPHANAATVCDLARRHPDVDLAVFPELFLCGYDLRDVGARALAPDDTALEAIRDAARAQATAVMVGFAERREDGRVANAVACIDADGAWAATYRKTHLFGDGEPRAFAPGETLCVTELAGVRVGPLICFDVEFPEPARALAQAGAELLVTVAANMAPYAPDHALAARARALDNRRPHLYVNRAGAEAGLQFAGGSAAIAPDGSWLATLGGEPGVVCVEIDVAARPEDDVDYLAQLRPDLAVESRSPSTEEGERR